MTHSFSTSASDAKSPRVLSAQGPAEEPVFDISALLGPLWRGKLFLLGCMLLGVLLGGYYAYRVATPVFRSTAVVMLDTREEQVVNLDSVLGGLQTDIPAINTEVEILRSRILAGRVVDRLNLVEDPEFNVLLQEPDMMARLRQLVSDFFHLLEGEDSTQLTVALSEEERAQRIRSRTVSRLLAATTVRNIAQSLVFEINVTTEDPRKSALIADTLVDLYINSQLDEKFEATEQATSWLTSRVSELQTDLENAEARVSSFKSDIDLINPESLAALERQLKEIRDRIAAAQLSRDTLAARLDRLDAARTPEAQAAAIGDPRLQAMLPLTPTTQSSFAVRVSEARSRAAVELQRAEVQLTALKASEAEQQQNVDRQSADLIQLQQLTREAEANRLLYEYFLTRLKETSAQQGIQQADSRRLSEAVIPNGPSEPRKSFIMAASALIGLLIGAALILIRESWSNTFRSGSELEQGTGYAVVGQIPLLPARRRKDSLTYLAERPTSAAAEAVRNMRTSILLSNIDHPPKVLVVSSSMPGEGKTTISIALAQNLAQMGKRVLLIEGDIRRQIFRQYFNVTPQHNGLVSVLSGESSLQESVARIEALGADVLLFTEKTSLNAADFFSSESFARMIRNAGEVYDHIIIDTPPVLVVPDARIIAQVADSLLFVVKWDSTPQQRVQEAINLFASVNRPINGLVLNQINPRGQRRYGYGGYGYGYGYRYAKNYYNN